MEQKNEMKQTKTQVFNMIILESKLLLIDLAICSVWMLSMFGGWGNWANPIFLFILLEVLFRIVISFALAHKEKRSWLPLLIFVPLIALSVVGGMSIAIGLFMSQTFARRVFPQ